MEKKALYVATFLCVFICLTGCKQVGDSDNGDIGQKITPKGVKYPSDFNFVEVPNPLSGKNPTYQIKQMPMPEVGKQFKDAQFNTLITRVTQKTKIRHEYSRYDPFNQDQSMIILEFPDSGYKKVYRTGTMPYEAKSNRVLTLDIAEPRWDPKDPNIIWGNDGIRLYKLDVKTKKKRLVKDFSKESRISSIIEKEKDIDTITMKDEGESSWNKRYWAFALQGSKEDYRLRYIFTWDLERDKILGIYEISSKEREIDWVGMSPKGDWVLIGGADYNGGNLKGLVMADKELKNFHRLNYDTAHSDVGLDSDGNEVIVMQNNRTDYIDLIPISTDTKSINEVQGSYKNTNRTKLVRLFYSSGSPHGLADGGIHISCNFPGYAVISTHIAPGEKEKNWLDRSIVMAKLDRKGPKVFYLAKLYNTTREYWEETQATITDDGSKVVWPSNWDANVGKEEVFMLQLDMPDKWTDLVGKTGK